MPSLRRNAGIAALLAVGTLAGLFALEIGARFSAYREEHRQGRFERDLEKAAAPRQGATVTLGQMIRRSRNPRVVYELKPRLDVVFAGSRVSTSDAGYRGHDAAATRTPGTYRLVGIGDSYMFGQGVSDDETYLSLLASRISDPRGRTLETVNLAVPGYNTAMEVESLKDRFDSIHPDAVLIEIVGNDLDLPNFLWKPVDVFSPARSFLFAFIHSRFRSTDADGGVDLVEAPSVRTDGAATYSRSAAEVPAQYESLVGLRAFELAVADLSRICSRNRVPVFAMTHGVWFEGDMTRILDRERIPLLILRSALRQRARALGSPDYARSPLAISPHDLHPSAAGHRVIAEELATWLTAQQVDALVASPAPKRRN